jgi:phosphoglycerate kinase
MIYGPATKDSVEALPEGGVILLENLRYVPDEEENSSEFAKQIVESTGAELFVQDGFAVIHRAHASTDAIAKLLPAVSGFLVENEVSKLEAAMSNPEHPLVVLIGGAKVEDKTPMIEQFLPVADQILVGGKIAADGYTTSDAKVYVAEDFATNDEGAKLDIGPKATEFMVNAVRGAKTVVWNGTMGMTEDERFAAGSKAVAEAMGSLDGAMTIVGGGDTAGYVESLLKAGNSLNFSLVSTGGGASLELLSGKKLPGLEVLQDA